MRKCMMSLAAMALAGAASAITVTWRVGEMTFYGGGNQVIEAALIAGSFSQLGVTGDTLSQFVGVGTGNTGANFAPVQPDYADSLTNLAAKRQNASDVPADGKKAWEVSFGDVTLEEGKTYTILFGDMWWYNQANGGHQYAQWAEFTYSEKMLYTDGNLYLGVDAVDLKTGPVATGPLTPAVLPEPTALALLALGVAGLALRRRAA